MGNPTHHSMRSARSPPLLFVLPLALCSITVPTNSSSRSTINAALITMLCLLDHRTLMQKCVGRASKDKNLTLTFNFLYVLPKA